MKKLFATLLFAAGFAASSLCAADFTGTVTWSMRFEITDPEMKKELDEKEKQMSGPEAEAQLQAARDAMNSPEGQAMMQANPQMREMMEKQLKALSKPGGISNLLPKGFTLHIKGPRSLVKTEGGMGAGDVLTLADKNESYQIDHEARTYRKLTTDESVDADETKFKVTKTGKSAKVLGYTCEQYLIETSDAEGTMTYTVWATDDIKGLDARSLNRLRLGQSSGPDFFSKIDGVPLRIEGTTPQMKLFMEATAVKSESLADSLFTLPKGFTELPPL